MGKGLLEEVFCEVGGCDGQDGEGEAQCCSEAEVSSVERLIRGVLCAEKCFGFWRGVEELLDRCITLSRRGGGCSSVCCGGGSGGSCIAHRALG